MAVEPDWSTVVVDHPDARATQRVLQAMPALVAQPWVGRQLRRWFKAAGLTNIVVRPVAVVTMNPAAVALDTQVRLARQHQQHRTIRSLASLPAARFVAMAAAAGARACGRWGDV